MAAFCKKTAKINYSIAFLSLLIYALFIATAKELSFLWIAPIILQILFLKVDILKLIKKLLKVNFFILLTVIVLIFEKKMDLAFLIFVRANLILWFTLGFNFDGFKLYKALNNLKVSNKFSLILFFTVKYIEVLFENVKRFKQVLEIRSFEANFNLKTLKTYAQMFAFLLYISINKMQKVEDVIRLRTKNNNLFPTQKISFGYEEFIFLTVILGVIFVYYFK